MSTDADTDFWERPELVERFAARDPDLRLVDLVERYPEPSSIRVLDLGCAGGRNTVPLAQRGFDVFALDSSRAMVARTRERLAPILGADQASRRVGVGGMEDLSAFADGSFALVVGLGVYHQAPSVDIWERALDETARVLKPGGRLLYASFHPETAPDGRLGHPVPGQPDVFSGFRSGTLVLVDVDRLERALATRGLIPEVESDTVRVATEKGMRVTVNGLFVRMDTG